MGKLFHSSNGRNDENDDHGCTAFDTFTNGFHVTYPVPTTRCYVLEYWTTVRLLVEPHAENDGTYDLITTLILSKINFLTYYLIEY